VILINETLARTYFGDADPVGVDTNRGRIVGVVGDVRQVDLDRPTIPEIYYPLAQNWSQVAELGLTLVVRSTRASGAIIDVIRSRVHDVNPRLAIFNVRTMEQVVSDSLWDLDLYRWLTGWFAMLTLVLAVVGVYGVVSYSVTARRREWAVRLALGSTQANVARIVLARGVVLAAIGIAIGVVLVTLRSVGSELPFVSGTARGAIFASVAASMFAVAFGASWLPAARVGRIAPVEILRAE
jgi:predicted lysophospholipase L1 biosynthesis ABC-type transport system permease subunit